MHNKIIELCRKGGLRKEVAKEILSDIFDDVLCGDLGEFCGEGWVITVEEAEKLFKKYGVKKD